jgi:DNA-binding transcriptional LysR family regulator
MENLTLTILDLMILRLLAQGMSLRAISKCIYRSNNCVSTRMRRLQDSLGFKLYNYDETPKPVVLTRKGHELSVLADDFLKRLDIICASPDEVREVL